MKLAVFCSGRGSNFQAILDAVRRRRLRAEVAVMVCDNPRAYALERARRAGVPVFCFDSRRFADRADYEHLVTAVLRSQGVGLVVLAGFMRILTPVFVRAWRGRILNIHPSYLPEFKGAHAIRDAFRAGVRQTGVTVHWVTQALDAGPPVLRQRVPVRPSDTLETLEARIHRVEHRLYPAAIKRVIDGARKRAL